MIKNSLPQRGFLQGVIIFALALFAVIIAVLSFETSDSAYQLGREQAMQLAGQIIAGGNKINSGYLTAKSGGMEPFKVDSSGAKLINLVQPLASGLPVDSESWSLAEYVVFPKIDNDAFSGNVSLPFLMDDLGLVGNQGVYGSLNKGLDCTADPNMGACTLVVTLSGLKKAVCAAINLKTSKITEKTFDHYYNSISNNTISAATSLRLVFPYGGFDYASANIEFCYLPGGKGTNYTYVKLLHINWAR